MDLNPADSSQLTILCELSKGSFSELQFVEIDDSVVRSDGAS